MVILETKFKFIISSYVLNNKGELYINGISKYLQRLECVALVENSKFSVPPSGLIPSDAARASIKVDLPMPFSPTKKVTSFFSSNSLKFFIIFVIM